MNRAARLEWRKVEPRISKGADVGGDIQVTDAWDVRFRPVDEPSDGLHALVTVYHYGVCRDDKQVGEYWVQRQVEYMICTDPADPGDTEVWCDYDFDDLGEVFRNKRDVAKAARTAAEETDAEYITWDGRTQEVHP